MAEKDKDTSFTAYSQKPVKQWTIEEVADYARKVLNFTDCSANVLVKAGVDGLSLLAYQKVYDLLDDFKEETKKKDVTKPSLRKLWAEIEKLKQSSLKRKLDQISNTEQNDDSDQNITKKQKVGTSPPKVSMEARDAFKVTAEKIPTWTEEDKNSLVTRLQLTIELNELPTQQKIYGTALQEVLPIAPYDDGYKVFEWFMCNVLPDELKKFSRMVSEDKSSGNIQDRNYWLVYQVSGAGKTKIAYELSAKFYTIVVRCVDDATLNDIRRIFSLDPHFYDKLDFKNRMELPYYSLYIAYAWIRAHLKFLEFYQNDLVPKFNLTEKQQQMYFHLIQRKGSPAAKFIAYQALSEISRVTLADRSSSIKQRFLDLIVEIRALIKKTKTKAIVFDELLTAKDIGTAMFAHNSMLQNTSIRDADIAASQQLEMHREHRTTVLSQPDNCEAKEFSRATSLVNGVMHFVATFKMSTAFIITDTSQSVREYFVNYTGPRSRQMIQEFVPNAYMSSKDLSFYFNVPNTPKLMDALKMFQGRGMFFVSYFFLQELLPMVKEIKPSSNIEVEAMVFEILNLGEIQNECRRQSKAIVADFYTRMAKSQEVTRAVEVSISLSAGLMARKRLEVTKQINQTLAFISSGNTEECFITEPFILEALSRRNTEEIKDPDDDTVFQIYAELLNRGPKDGKTISKGEVLEVLIARCLQRNQRALFCSAFSDSIELSGLSSEKSLAALAIDCRIAGTIEQFQKRNSLLQEFNFYDWLEHRAFVFPSILMKPDGITFLFDQQSKTEVLCLFQMRFYEKELSPSQVIKAVNTLNPNNFYNKKKQHDIGLRKHWLTQLNSDDKTRELFKRYVRVIVSAKGFTEDSIALIRAYNSLETSKQTPIVLFAPTAEIFGLKLLDAMGLNLKHFNAGPNSIENNDSRLTELSVTLPMAENQVQELIPPVTVGPAQAKMVDFYTKLAIKQNN